MVDWALHWQSLLLLPTDSTNFHLPLNMIWSAPSEKGSFDVNNLINTGQLFFFCSWYISLRNLMGDQLQQHLISNSFSIFFKASGIYMPLWPVQWQLQVFSCANPQRSGILLNAYIFYYWPEVILFPILIIQILIKSSCASSVSLNLQISHGQEKKKKEF